MGSEQRQESMPTRSSHVDTYVLDRLPARELWPEIILDDPRFAVPSSLNAASALLDTAIERGWGPRPCVGLGSEMWSYQDIFDWSNRIAAVLTDDYGVVPGNRVLLRAPNAPWTVAAWFAVLKAGAVAVTTMPQLRKPELTKIYAKCRPSVTLCESGMEGPVLATSEAPVALWGAGGDLTDAAKRQSGDFPTVQTAADDPALLGFTSSTTGEPKAAVHFHRDLLAIDTAFAPVLNAQEQDIFVGTPPLAFTFGLGGLVVFPMRVGAATWFCEQPGPAALADLIERRQATVCFTSPTAYRAMLRLEPRPDLTSLRRAVSAGETLPRATFESMQQHTGVTLINGVGTTELLHIFLSAGVGDIRPGATGKPLPGWHAAILDDSGDELNDGEIGHLAVKGPIGCRYLDDERQSDYVQDGWNITGDAFMRDKDGYYWYQARTDDMIVSSGYNIAAPEVEEALLSHPLVAEAAVVGDPDEERGEVLHAFVHLTTAETDSTSTTATSGSQSSDVGEGDSLVQELQDHVKNTIAPYKYPRRITFCSEPLPKTATGKLSRRKLRART